MTPLRFVLVGLGDEERVAFLAESLLERWPDDPLVLFNLAAWASTFRT